MITQKINAAILTFTFLIFEFAIVADAVRADKGEMQTIYTGVPARDLYVELPDIRYVPDRVALKSEQGTFQPYLLTYKRMKLTSVGRHFITAYCPYECGDSWSTASGETCHRADYEHRLSEPTTAAIDLKYYSFDTEFYIPEFDRTFVAEDTGAFSGKWIDLFYEDYGDVLSFPTGYYEVYLVEWEEITVIVTEWDHEALDILPPTEYYRNEVYEE